MSSLFYWRLLIVWLSDDSTVRTYACGGILSLGDIRGFAHLKLLRLRGCGFSINLFLAALTSPV